MNRNNPFPLRLTEIYYREIQGIVMERKTVMRLGTAGQGVTVLWSIPRDVLQIKVNDSCMGTNLNQPPAAVLRIKERFSI